MPGLQNCQRCTEPFVAKTKRAAKEIYHFTEKQNFKKEKSS